MPVYEQPGRTTTVDRDGKEILSVTFVGDIEADPPTDIIGIQKSKSVVRDVAGQVRTTFTFEVDNPFSPNRTSTSATVEYVSSVRTVPIEAHPNFAEQFISPEEKKKIKDAVQVPDRSPSFNDFTNRNRAISLYGYLVSGIDSYYEPSLIIRKTYTASTPPQGRRIGKIASPGVPVYGAGARTNFLLISITARGTPGNYQVVEEYEMSGPNGWDTFLYG